jgi:hypothetical protein
MPHSADATAKSKKKSLLKKPKLLAPPTSVKKKKKKEAKIASVVSEPSTKSPGCSEKISKKKSGIAAPKNSSSAVSGKVADIVNPLVLNYWNGRGLMEVPRMMLGKQFSSFSAC